MPIRVDLDLREINCGLAEGLTLEAVRVRYPDHWRRNLEQRDPEFRWPGGECYRELRERSIAAIRRIADEHRGERVLIVTHAGVISQLVGVVHGSSPARWEDFRPRNGSITELHVSSRHFTIQRFDDLPSEEEPALAEDIALQPASCRPRSKSPASGCQPQ
jgi:broad specificity phosphatase PhoE